MTGVALLNVASANLPGGSGRVFAGEPFPALRVCEDPDAALANVTSWIDANRGDLESQLARCGAVLFRGFPLRRASDFDAFVSSFGAPNFPYDESLSNAVRVNLTERVFTANEAPPTAQIRFHHEMAQTPLSPRALFFFCEQPARRGGATPLCRSDVLFAQLARERPAFARDCEEKGLRYHTVMPSADDASSGQGRSWRSTFGVEARADAEARMRALGYEWEWLDDGSLHAISPLLPAVRELGGEASADVPSRKSFYNQLIAALAWGSNAAAGAPPAVTFGDGSPVPADDAAYAAELAESLAVDVAWQAGDVAWVDNRAVMHGRRSFEGTRRVLASLVGDAR